MKIIPIELPRLYAEEWFGIMSDYKETVPRFGADVLGIADLFERFEVLHGKADKGLQVLQKSAFTAGMVAADKERNKLVRSIYEVVKASRSLLAVADQEAAERLYILISTYRKNALDGSYAEESSAIYNLLQDLDGKYAADVTLLGIGKFVEHLHAAEHKFQTLRANRTQESISKPKVQLAEIRKQTDAIYRSSVNVINAKLVAQGLGGNVVVDPDDLENSGDSGNAGGSGSGPVEEIAPLEQHGNTVYNFVIAWNETVKKYHNLLAVRAGRRAKKTDDTVPDDNEPDDGEPDDGELIEE